MDYKEQRELTIRLHLSAEFGEDYEGEDDGYAWYREFDEQIRPELVRELMRVLASRRGWKITPINRGLDTHEELELLVERMT